MTNALKAVTKSAEICLSKEVYSSFLPKHLAGICGIAWNKSILRILGSMYLFALIWSLSSMTIAAPLVSDDSIKLQKSLTETTKLKNSIPLVIRRSDDSELFQILVQYKRGLKDLPPGKKALNEWMFASVPTASRSYGKEAVFKLTSKYDLDLACSGGVEISHCSLGTVNDALSEALPLFASLVKEPLFREEDIKLTKDRLVAKLKNIPSDPNQYINDVVNSVFYPKGYPYRLNQDEALAELEALGKKDIDQLYQSILNASDLAIIVVTSLPNAEVKALMERFFGDIKAKPSSVAPVKPPVFDPKNTLAFVDRDLPTAFIRLKMNAPDENHPDSFATQLFYEILSKELAEEIRTKRSLSYAVQAAVVQYSVGIGIINVSTSKPKETIEAIDFVIQKMRKTQYTQEQIEEFKNIFATSLYLTQETHSSLALALSQSLYYYNDPTRIYELTRDLDRVKPSDITRLAKQILVQPRFGVIFKSSGFDRKWVDDFVAKYSTVPK